LVRRPLKKSFDRENSSKTGPFAAHSCKKLGEIGMRDIASSTNCVNGIPRLKRLF